MGAMLKSYIGKHVQNMQIKCDINSRMAVMGKIESTRYTERQKSRLGEVLGSNQITPSSDDPE